MNEYPKLPKTTSEIKKLQANTNRPLGMHSSGRIELTKNGRMINEIPYDEVKHHQFEPDPISIQSMLTDEEYISYREPYKPLTLSVVMHADPNSHKYAKWITRAKDDTMLTLAGAISKMKLGYGDRVRTYSVGDVERLKDNPLYKGSNYSLETKDNDEASHKIADICNNGLTYILSSFNNLDFQDEKSIAGRGIVGIKINHVLEKELKPGTVKFSTGEKQNESIDTSDKKQLDEWNKILESRHETIVNSLGSFGLSIAQVVFEGRNCDPSYGFNVPAADLEIAAATRLSNKP